MLSRYILPALAALLIAQAAHAWSQGGSYSTGYPPVVGAAGSLVYSDGSLWKPLGAGTTSQVLQGGTTPSWVGTLPTAVQDNITRLGGLVTSVITNVGGNAISLTNATNNRINFNTAGAGAPTFTSYSNGARIILWDSIGAANAGTAIGLESGFTWFGAAATTEGWRWYGGTTLAATLTGTGNLTTTGTLTVNGTAPALILINTSSPASGAACTAGSITWDASYIYVCTASGAWKRAALTGGY